MTPAADAAVVLPKHSSLDSKHASRAGRQPCEATRAHLEKSMSRGAIVQCCESVASRRFVPKSNPPTYLMRAMAMTRTSLAYEREIPTAGSGPALKGQPV